LIFSAQIPAKLAFKNVSFDYIIILFLKLKTKADDDTYIFMENLRAFLGRKDSRFPTTFGYDLTNDVPHGYHSGGAGYILSQASLEKLGSTLAKDYSFCPNSGTEDTDVAKCLRKLQVLPSKSIDHLGRERFYFTTFS
jgi:glycoprotein-N-acetylgalactosamine 3-beta-galactosyltransferase